MKRGANSTQSENVRLAIEGDILSGRLGPGAVIDEEGIARKFEISRTPVREAILQLAHIGIVERRPRKGTVVAQMDVGRVIQMFEVMSEIEAICARFATRRMTQNERAALTRTHEISERALAAGDHGTYAANSHRFHVRIIQGTHNDVLIEYAHRLGMQLVPYRRFQLRYPGRSETNLREHGLILKAILSGDAEQAARLFKDHTKLQADALAEYVSLRGPGAETAIPAHAGQLPDDRPEEANVA
jgi:DNA-binding GntR family transcriptional regulator